MVGLQRKLYFSKDPEGVKHFLGGGGFNFFQWGVLIIIFKKHITCDFLGGSGPQIPPLDPHMKNCNLGPF